MATPIKLAVGLERDENRCGYVAKFFITDFDLLSLSTEQVAEVLRGFTEEALKRFLRQSALRRGTSEKTGGKIRAPQLTSPPPKTPGRVRLARAR